MVLQGEKVGMWEKGMETLWASPWHTLRGAGAESHGASLFWGISLWFGGIKAQPRARIRPTEVLTK